MMGKTEGTKIRRAATRAIGAEHPDTEELRQFSIDAILHGVDEDGVPANRRPGVCKRDFRPEKLAAALRAWKPDGGDAPRAHVVGWRLVQVGTKFRLNGVKQPDMELISRTERVIVFKVPGYSTNMSGVRGLRDDEYIPSEIRVYEIVEDISESTVVRELTSWPTRPSKDKP
jgi:hypothetical protein